MVDPTGTKFILVGEFIDEALRVLNTYIQIVLCSIPEVGAFVVLTLDGSISDIAGEELGGDADQCDQAHPLDTGDLPWCNLLSDSHLSRLIQIINYKLIVLKDCSASDDLVTHILLILAVNPSFKKHLILN